MGWKQKIYDRLVRSDPRIRRDAVILQQLAAGKSLDECNDRLAACGEVMIG